MMWYLTLERPAGTTVGVSQFEKVACSQRFVYHSIRRCERQIEAEK